MSYTAAFILLVTALTFIVSIEGAPATHKRGHQRRHNLALMRRNSLHQNTDDFSQAELDGRLFEDLAEKSLSAEKELEQNQEEESSEEKISSHRPQNTGYRRAGYRGRGTGRAAHSRRHNKQSKTIVARKAAAFFFHQAWPSSG